VFDRGDNLSLTVVPDWKTPLNTLEVKEKIHVIYKSYFHKSLKKRCRKCVTCMQKKLCKTFFFTIFRIKVLYAFLFKYAK